MYVLKTTLVYVQFLAFIGYGVAMKQATFQRKTGQYLPDSVITTKYAESEIACSMHCTRLDACVSVNYKARGVDQGLCQLNNKTTSEKLGLVSNNEFVHLFILKKTNKIVKKRSCKELFDDHRCGNSKSLVNGVHSMQLEISSSPYKVYCHMTDIPGCGGGGWTLVMKVDGRKSTFDYSSPLWTNKESYAVEDGLKGLTEKESKLASYWNTPFKKICLGMTVNGDRRWMALDYEASSLYSLIADKKYRSTTAGRNTWMSVIAGSSLQSNCNREGFNAQFGYIKARLGFVANNENDCKTCDSCIGFGINATSALSDDQACGNLVTYPRDSPVNIPAFGYILVQ